MFSRLKYLSLIKESMSALDCIVVPPNQTTPTRYSLTQIRKQNAVVPPDHTLLWLQHSPYTNHNTGYSDTT